MEFTRKNSFSKGAPEILEDKECSVCETEFQVGVGSNQTLCSTNCLNISERDYQQRKSENKRNGQIKEEIGQSIKNNEIKSGEKNIMKTKINLINEDEKKNEKIEMKSESLQTNITTEPKTQDGTQLSPVGSEVIHYTESNGPYKNLQPAVLDSMNLLEDTTQRLHGLIKQVAKDCDADRARRPWSTDNTAIQVQQTVEVAKQLHNVIRLKLDFVKTIHNITKEKKSK